MNNFYPASLAPGKGKSENARSHRKIRIRFSAALPVEIPVQHQKIKSPSDQPASCTFFLPAVPTSTSTL